MTGGWYASTLKARSIPKIALYGLRTASYKFFRQGTLAWGWG